MNTFEISRELIEFELGLVKNALGSRSDDQRSLLVLTLPKKRTPELDYPAHKYYADGSNQELLFPTPSNRVLRTDLLIRTSFWAYLGKLHSEGFKFAGILHGDN